MSAVVLMWRPRAEVPQHPPGLRVPCVACGRSVALGGASRRVVPTHRTRPPTIHQDETVEEAGHGGPASSTVYRTGARRPRQVTTGGAA